MKVHKFGALLVFAAAAVTAAPVSAASQITVTNNSQTPPKVAIYKKPVLVPKLGAATPAAPKPVTPPKHP